VQDNIRKTRSSLYGDAGIATILLLFAISAFAVLTIGALSTSLGSAVAGQTFRVFRSMPREAMLEFVAPLVVPNDWRSENAKGSYRFTLPVIVPETGGEDSGSTAAWHAIEEIPGVAVCCESRGGACSQRLAPSGGAPIADWIPGADDALRLSFDLATTPDASTATSDGDVVTATVTSGTAAAEGTAVACQLEWDGAVIAKGTAVLRQVDRDGADAASSKAVAGSMTIQVKTK
jgi:hypothetical protein